MKIQLPQPSIPQRISFLESLISFKEMNGGFLREFAEKMNLVTLVKDEILFSQGDSAKSMYLVIEGRLQVTIENRDGKKSIVQELGEGAFVGIIALLAGGRRNATVSALGETTLAELDREDSCRLLANYPGMKQHLLETVFLRLRRSHLAEVLPEYFEDMDEASFDYIESLFQWVHIDRGDVLFRKGDIGDSLYILINGLLHVVDEPINKCDNIAGQIRKLGVIQRGKIVGEMALLSDEKRTASIYAVRDSDLVRLSRAAFESISDKYPQVMIAITRIVVERLRNIREGGSEKSTVMNISVLPITPGVHVSGFCKQLADAFSLYGSTFLLTAETLDELLEKKGISQISNSDPRALGLRAWLADIEVSNAFNIYEGEENPSPWNRRCLDRADEVILLADADASPIPGRLERELIGIENGITSPRKYLVLLHRDDNRLPSGTVDWLVERDVQWHLHARWERKEDFMRLARILGNRAVGLALGGGAAKGIAHIGVIRALEETGIPIDMVAGSSMGAIIAAQYAMGNDYEQMLNLCKKLFIDINPFSEYTLPLVSLMKGRKLDRMGKVAFGDSYIEDLWLNFFCVSSNLSRSEAKVHHRGLVRNSVRASSSIPGVIAPVFIDGEVYVDGGVINNLPGDILRQHCGCVIVVEVSPNLDLNVDFDEVPSPWKILWSRIIPFKKRIEAPSILDIMFSTVLTGSFMAAKSVKSRADLSLMPPLKDIGFLDFKKMRQTAEIGYRYTKEVLGKLDDPELLALLKGT
jgi:predicted acylesterase/phospholipase RssA/CRP-like cAMP-binding protein